MHIRGQRILDAIHAIELYENATSSPILSADSPRMTRDSYYIPSDLPVWQWKGNVWDSEAYVHETVEDLLDAFNLIIHSNGLNIDSNWSRLIPIKMSIDQRSWFNEVLFDHPYSWNQVRDIIINTYGTEDYTLHIERVDQLLSLRMSEDESVEAFTDRFQRMRRAAKWADNFDAAALFKRALPRALREEVMRSLISNPQCQQQSIGKVASIARSVMTSNFSSINNAYQVSSASSSTSARPFRNGTMASRHNPYARRRPDVNDRSNQLERRPQKAKLYKFSQSSQGSAS